MGVKPRRMTIEDYLEAGLEPPTQLTGVWVNPHYIEPLDEVEGLYHGYEITGIWHDEMTRCEDCGDETGECGCDG